jgi:group I intron endonuclease
VVRRTGRRKRRMIVYKAANKVNGKCYVGLTQHKLNIRKSTHKSSMKNGEKTPFYVALRKYGWESFEWETLDTAESLEDLVKKEAHWIEKFNSLDSNFGYNSRKGNVTPKKADKTEKVRVRVNMRNELHEILERKAKETKRSLSNYIVYLLEQRKTKTKKGI